MNTLPILSLSHYSSLSILTSSALYKTALLPQTFISSQTLGFCSPKSLRTPNSPRFKASFNSPSSLYPIEPQLSDDEEEEEEEEEDEDDDDDDVAADEYNVVSGEVSDGVGVGVEVELSDDEIGGASIAVETEVLTRHEEFKWQRVERLCNEVKLFGEDIIDVDELASIHDFRIDKFQVHFQFKILKSQTKPKVSVIQVILDLMYIFFQRLAIQAFLRGSSVVVSAPTSSGKTLIAEAAAVATVARGRRIFYTTPLKALSNQKFREFRYRSSFFHAN